MAATKDEGREQAPFGLSVPWSCYYLCQCHIQPLHACLSGLPISQLAISKISSRSCSWITVSELDLALESARLNWDYFRRDSDAEFCHSAFFKSQPLDKLTPLSPSCPHGDLQIKKHAVCCLGSAAEGSLSRVWVITPAPGEITEQFLVFRQFHIFYCQFWVGVQKLLCKYYVHIQINKDF